MNIKPTKPIIKWAGGKRQLLSHIRETYPAGLGDRISKYAEPFIGGGAVLFDILTHYEMKEVYISDINKDLINLYRAVKEEIEDLIEILARYESQFIPLSLEDRKIYYYEKRDLYNQTMVKDEINVRKAALFIFLNKTCFNGLYRVNKKGGFNVPMGSYKNPCICDKDNLIEASKLLKNVQIYHDSYLKSDEFIDDHTFVYIDPPYRPLTTTSSFTAYSEFNFDDKEQIELAKFATMLAYNGASVILSNSDPKNINNEDNFFDDLYREFRIKRVPASRMINSKGSNRGKLNELLIANF